MDKTKNNESISPGFSNEMSEVVLSGEYDLDDNFFEHFDGVAEGTQ